MPKINIIGAGITGLCAGCYLRMNGYDTEIFELHTVPGGLCTAWKRKDYTFDTCIHWLVGSAPSDPFYKLWSELIDLKAIRFVDHEVHVRVEGRDGQCIRVYTDADRLERELLEKAPEDRAHIQDLTRAVRKFARFPTPIGKAPELMTPLDVLRMIGPMIPYLGDFRKWIRLTTRDYAARFRNSLLRTAVESVFLPEMAALFMVFTLSWMHKKSAGYPVGGSLPFARQFERRYLGLGGTVRYGARVRRILTEGEAPNARAVGVELEDGTVHRSDRVLSAADGHATVFDLLGGKFLDSTVRSYYETMDPFPSYLQVSLGLARTFDDPAPSIQFPLERPLRVDPSQTVDRLGVRIHRFDPTLAPPGKTACTVLLATRDHGTWMDLRQNRPDEYRAEKERIAEAVIDALDRRFGRIKENVEVKDVSTPATVIRYTNNWKGSFEGWMLTPRTGMRSLKKTLPGLANFMMAGQWVEPGGGLPSAILSARNAAQVICRKDGNAFRTA